MSLASTSFGHLLACVVGLHQSCLVLAISPLVCGEIRCMAKLGNLLYLVMIGHMRLVDGSLKCKVYILCCTKHGSLRIAHCFHAVSSMQFSAYCNCQTKGETILDGSLECKVCNLC